jgi:mannose-6-phosphate isomerase
VFRLDNPVRRYEWGSRSAIQAMLGLPAEVRPMAELWIGAHPDSPSRAVPGGHRLDALIAERPGAMLGDRPWAGAGPGARLGFLAKILAAAAPLSLQVHPDGDQARSGCAAEDARGLAPEDPARRYRDRGGKPELLYALTSFEALAGLRPPGESARLVEALGVGGLRPLVERLDGAADHRAAFEWLFDCREAGADWTAELGAAAGAVGADSGAGAERGAGAAFGAVRKLAALYPGDPTGIVPLLLNCVTLAAGEALFIPARTFHAYLGGVGIELMAESDNVLRAGLTPKLVDPAEVARVANFEPAEPRLLAGGPGPEGAGWTRFHAPGCGFGLSAGTVAPGNPAVVEGPGPRLVGCLDGAIRLAGASGELALEGLAAAFVSHAAGAVRLTGEGRAFVAR